MSIDEYRCYYELCDVFSLNVLLHELFFSISDLRIRLITSAEVLPLFLCLWNLLKCTKTNAQRSSISQVVAFVSHHRMGSNLGAAPLRRSLVVHP